MNRQRLTQYEMIAILIPLLLVGCGAPPATPTPVPPKIPPTRTPITLVEDVEMLIGNWQPLGGRDAMFLQINPDGTCRQSISLEQLMDNSQVECTYIFETSVLTMTVVKLNGVPACPSPTGSYEVRLITDDQIQLAVDQDSCAPRKRSTAGLYQRIP